MKAAVINFTKVTAIEYASDNIRCNCFCPGMIDTEIHASGGLPNRVREVGPQMPLGRAGSAQEVAQAIVWFLNEDSSYCTGSILDVSGAR